MGTMYETCAISNMPIVYGDEVVIFLIEKRTNRHKEWAAKGSANGWYNPISLPMFAKFTWDEEFKISEHAYILKRSRRLLSKNISIKYFEDMNMKELSLCLCIRTCTN